ncbi:AzlD domain-containing protein, partial [Vibrio breoganii]
GSLTAYWLATLVGTLFTLLIWYWKRSLGLPVLAGVAIYGAIIYVGRLV